MGLTPHYIDKFGAPTTSGQWMSLVNPLIFSGYKKNWDDELVPQYKEDPTLWKANFLHRLALCRIGEYLYSSLSIGIPDGKPGFISRLRPQNQGILRKGSNRKERRAFWFAKVALRGVPERVIRKTSRNILGKFLNKASRLHGKMHKPFRFDGSSDRTTYGHGERSYVKDISRYPGHVERTVWSLGPSGAYMTKTSRFRAVAIAQPLNVVPFTFL
jgi:hypothetical protein